MIELFWNRGKKKDWACAKCGKLNHPDGEFCEFCGHSKHQAVIANEAPSIQKSKEDMVKCPVCGAECTVGVQFCSNCGTALKKPSSTSIPVQVIAPEPQHQEVLVRCVHCGTMNHEHNRFCSHCSEEIRVEKVIAAEQEKRQQVSTYFCPECGARCPNETTFCNECGTKITIGQ